MKPHLLYTIAVTTTAVFLQGCVGLQDDGFAHAVKSGNSRAAVSSMEPAQTRLHIYERDGRWYYPIHYTICRGDTSSTFALIRNGSPTRLDGKSLAYNAARVNQLSLAKQLASAGYGSDLEVSQALAQRREDRRNIAQANGAAVLGVVALFALMGSAGSGDQYNRASSGFTEQENRDINAAEYEYNR